MEKEELVLKYIKEDNNEKLWNLAFDSKDKRVLKTITDYYIRKRNSFYICELISTENKYLDLDYLFDNVLKTKDKEFMFYILNNGTINSINLDKYFSKIKKFLDS